MPIADAQIRGAMLAIWGRTKETIERMSIPMEWVTSGKVAFMDKDMAFTEADTGQRLYALVYVMLSETQEAIEEQARTLMPLGDE